jgi:Icc-related predicted phosphoesterase
VYDVTMKVAATSDIHSRLAFDIPKCDLFIIAGDLCLRGSLAEVGALNEFLSRQRSKFTTCIVTPGNHDAIFESDLSLAAATLTNATVLIDQEINLSGFRIWASPWTPTFGNWHFMKDRGTNIRRKWDLIPEGLDILITHGPPRGILDATDGRYTGGRPLHVGCDDLLNVLQSMKSPPRYHIFGHIHHSFGKQESMNTTYLNVCLVDEDYAAKNQPVEFELFSRE